LARSEDPGLFDIEISLSIRFFLAGTVKKRGFLPSVRCEKGVVVWMIPAFLILKTQYRHEKSVAFSCSPLILVIFLISFV